MSSSPVDWIIDGGAFHVTQPSGKPFEGSLTIQNARFFWEEAAALGTMCVTYTTRVGSSDRLFFFGGVIPNDINLVGGDQMRAVSFRAGRKRVSSVLSSSCEDRSGEGQTCS